MGSDYKLRYTGPTLEMLEFTFSSEDTDAKMVAMGNGFRVIAHLLMKNVSL